MRPGAGKREKKKGSPIEWFVFYWGLRGALDPRPGGMGVNVAIWRVKPSVVTEARQGNRFSRGPIFD